MAKDNILITLSDNILYVEDLELNKNLTDNLSPYQSALTRQSIPFTSSSSQRESTAGSSKRYNKTIWVVPITEQFVCSTFIYSPLKLCDCCVEMLNKVLGIESNEELNYEELKNIAFNLAFYIENIPGLLYLSLEKKEQEPIMICLSSYIQSSTAFLKKKEVNKYINQR